MFTLALSRRVIGSALILALSAIVGSNAQAQTLPGTLTYSGAGGIFQPGAAVGFDLTGNPAIPTAGITGFTVRINGLSYNTRESGDLRAYLVLGGVGTTDQGIGVPVFEFATPPGGGGYAERDFQGTYSFGTSFTTPLIPATDGMVASGDYAFVGDPQALLARIANLGGVGAPASVGLVFADDYGFNGVGSFESFEVGVSFAPATSTVPEPSTWALLGSGLLAIGGVARRRARS